jgi:hypothetical protein
MTAGEEYLRDVGAAEAGEKHLRNIGTASGVTKEEANGHRPSAATPAPELALEPRILNKFGRDVRLAGLVGEEALAKLILLALVSRHFDRPVNVVVKGPSAAGKSYAVQQVLRFVPKTAYLDLTSMSELGLVYMEEEVSHRVVVLYEAFALSEDSAAAYIVRSLLSEGRIKHQTTIKQKGVRIEKEGPTGLITTTTKVTLFDENETRLLSVTVDDTKEQTRRVMGELARRAQGTSDTPPNVEPWHRLLTWLESGEHRVVVPFAEAVSDLTPPMAIRLRRDFNQILVLVQAHALLHRALRDTDGGGRIVATLDDYDEVRNMVAPVVADAAEATVTGAIRKTVEAVAALTAEYPGGVSLAAVAKRLDIDKAAASRRVARARDRGFLQNEEDRPGRSSRLKLGDPLPEDKGILPSRADIEAKFFTPRIEVNGSTVTEPGSMVKGGSTVKTAPDQEERGTVDPLTPERETRESVDLVSSKVPARSTGATDFLPTAMGQIPGSVDELARMMRAGRDDPIAIAYRCAPAARGNLFALARALDAAGHRHPDGQPFTPVMLQQEFAERFGPSWRKEDWGRPGDARLSGEQGEQSQPGAVQMISDLRRQGFSDEKIAGVLKTQGVKLPAGIAGWNEYAVGAAIGERGGQA